MIIFFLVLYGIMARTLKIRYEGVNEDYLSKENTQIIKGVFIIIVFMSHIRGYIDCSTVADQFVVNFLKYLGQLMVAMFLFCSGYGIYESIKRKGKTYIDQFPKNRIWKTWIDFAMAILLFLVLNLLIQQKYSFVTILLSFVGWESVGNSAWYMFAIFTLYIITYISFKLFGNKNVLAIMSISFCSLIYIYALSRIKESWWCDTYLCFVFGMWYSYFLNNFNAILKKIKEQHYYVLLIIVLLVYLFLAQYRYKRIMAFNITAIAFCLLLVVLMMKVSFDSKILSWFGENLFWVYILQRIPMIFFQWIGLSNVYKDIYIVVCLGFTIVLTIVMNRVSVFVKSRLCK